MKKHAGGTDFLSIPRLERIPYVVHGFGKGQWRDSDFRKKAEWASFRLFFLNQVHSDIIQFIDESSAKKARGDAMITNIPGFLLVIKTADCLPVLIVDVSRKVIAAVHCGWRGTSKRVIQKAIQGMIGHYGCRSSSLLVALGPCISSECYEVGEDVLHTFRKSGLSTQFFRDHPSKQKKHLFDLEGANISQMMDLGVQKRNVFSTGCCTHCDESLLSYRRDRNKAGRMLSFIGIKT